MVEAMMVEASRHRQLPASAETRGFQEYRVYAGTGVPLADLGRLVTCPIPEFRVRSA